MTTAVQREMHREAQAQGYSFRIDRWPRRATYYKPDGEAMPGLPADPQMMEVYFRKGFTLTPPGADAALAAKALQEPIGASPTKYANTLSIPATASPEEAEAIFKAWTQQREEEAKKPKPEEIQQWFVQAEKQIKENKLDTAEKLLLKVHQDRTELEQDMRHMAEI